jgi:anti-sigma regulatory factor (Ser/Thr protein kinase)
MLRSMTSWVGGTLENAANALPSPALRHEGIPYSGPAALVLAASALVTESLRRGDACMALAGTAKIHALRASLAGQAEDATFFDMSVHGRNPARVLPALQSFVDGHRDRRLRMIAEPVPVEISAAARAEAEFNELILDLPTYRNWPATLSCFYDVEALDRAAAQALATAHRDRPAAEDAEAALLRRFGAELPPAPSDAERTSADLTTLSDLRGSVGRFAAAAGLDAERIDDLVYAVNEVVTNSICHGEGRARVLTWRNPVGVWCQVQDRGRISDPLVGRVAPRPGQANGRGLWLVNQLCDLVQVRSSAAGTVVRMSVEY